jgi:class 3 adenylate cyclase/tetratricopeptide (TPR) repeat protein
MEIRTERRIVTCLFVDIVGSTDGTARLGPELMQRRLGDAFAQMSATIADYGGTVEKYIGDAIFALFGAPVAQVDDPERALRAAEACARWSSAGPPTAARLAIRVGIETGDALVDLAALEHRQRMAVGAAVNIAARLQQHADPGEIVVGPTCHEATASMARFESLGSLDLKGLGEIESWRFVDFGVTETVPEVEFVGRAAELELLNGAAEQANQGTATLVLIVGSPGQGKSRLAEEAISKRRTLGPIRHLRARCRPGAETGVNTPLLQLLSADIPEPTVDGVKARVAQLLDQLDSTAVASAICHSAGLAPDERMLAITRYEQRELIAAAWRNYLSALARERPLIVSIEDLHWGDPVLVRILDHVTTDLDSPLLVLATARPEFVGSAHLRPRENRIQIDLGPLDATASELLARIARTSVAGLERAGGNPLFIIELARSHSVGADLPLTILAAIAARLDELSAVDRQLLQHASVAGETFDVRDAALLDDREPAEVAGMLGRIAHLGFIAPVGAAYRFHHALVHDVAYSRLPVAERMALHARYAEQGVDASDVEARAHHLWEAAKPAEAQWVWEDADRLSALRHDAFEAHIAAGARLEKRNQYEQAVGLYERAVELASEPAEVGKAEAGVGRAYARQGRGDEAWAHRLSALDAYNRAGLTAPSDLYADMLEIATMNWGYFQHLPDDAAVMRLLAEGESSARASGDEVSLVRLLMERASFTGDTSAADEVVSFVDSPDALRFADAAQRTAMVYCWGGQIARAMELFGTVFDELLPRGAAINEPEALLWYGAAALHAGNLELAETLVDRAQHDAANGRSAHTQQHALSLRSIVSFARGDWGPLGKTTRDLEQLVEANPDASFCVIGCSGIGYGAAGSIVSGDQGPADLDAISVRMIGESEILRASAVMLPRAMEGDGAAAVHGLAAYAPNLRLWDRAATWDFSHLIPAIALTVIEQWDELGPVLARLDACASGGSRLAGAAAAAIREEQAATGGGTAPTHEELRALGYLGISEILRFRAASVAFG